MKPKYFKRREGVVAIPRTMLRSPASRGLSLAARCLIIELQNRWAPSRGAVNFSTREAGDALGVSQATAVRAFDELASAGFIELATPADHGGRRARGWRTTWNPAPDGREPTDDWALEKNLAIHHESANPRLRFTSKARTRNTHTPRTNNQRLSDVRDSPRKRERARCDSPEKHLVFTMWEDPTP